MKDIHHARQMASVPAGVSGYWCQRCERRVELPETAGTPAKCPHCRKWTVVWVPPQMPSDECGVQQAPEDGTPSAPVDEPTAKEWFERMRRTIGL